MSTSDLIIFQVVGVDLSEERRIVEDIHSYACKGPPPPPPPETEGESASIIINKTATPTKMKNLPPKRKRGRAQRFAVVDLPLVEVQNNIIQALAEKINTRSDQLEKMIRRSSEEVERMSEALSSVHRLVLDLKEDNQQLRRKMKMDLQANKQEELIRGFNLRLCGVTENPSENLTEKVRDVCRSLVPEEEDNVAAAVDSAHRLGRPRAVKPRPVVIRFTSTAARNLLWKRAKKSIFLQSRGWRFKKDLVSRNKATRSGVWSEVEEETEGDVSNLNICEEEVLGDQERNSSLDQTEPESKQIQKDQEELKPDPTLTDQEEPESAEIDKALSQETDPFTVVPPGDNKEEPEPNMNQQNCAAAENPDQDGNGVVVCRACGKACPDSDALLAHAANHQGDAPNVCCFCGKFFAFYSVLRRHLRVHTAQKPFVCELCGRAFAAKRTLLDHTRVHTGEKPFTCDTCGRAFVRRENMMIHKRSHSAERSYSCDVCGKTFRRIDTLSAHRKIHTGEKRFGCEKCGKRFITSSSCKIHMKTHSSTRTDGKRRRGEGAAAAAVKRFPCDVCQKDFSYKWNLLIHMRIHTGEKPFSCQICGRSFHQKGGLKAHIKIHSNRDSHTCGTCGRSCSNRGALMLHMKVHRKKEHLENVQS